MRIEENRTKTYRLFRICASDG